MMKIVIAGGTGTVGKELARLLIDKGHQVIILTRKSNQSAKGKIKYLTWLSDGANPAKEIGKADAFVNLAGVSINAGRWSRGHQQQIYESRMKATDEIIRIMQALPEKPQVLINASAVGIYPASFTKIYTEASEETAHHFLGRTVRDWEARAKEAEAVGIRVCFMRFGIVLSKEGKTLPLLALPYRLFIGGRIGSGKQWVSWIHVKDAARAILFAMENENIRGAINVTAPNPVTMEDFGKTIANVLHRPHWLPVPSFALKVILGKKSALVLEGQYVEPKALCDHGFEFFFPTLTKALEDLLGKQ